MLHLISSWRYLWSLPKIKHFAFSFYAPFREKSLIYRNVIIKEKNRFWSSILLSDASISSQLVAITRTQRAAGRYRAWYRVPGNALAASFIVRDNFCEASYLYLLHMLCPLCLREFLATRIRRPTIQSRGSKIFWLAGRITFSLDSITRQTTLRLWHKYHFLSDI